jgi:hypothetical protein
MRSALNILAFYVAATTAILFYGYWPRKPIEAEVVYFDDTDVIEWSDRKLFDKDGPLPEPVEWTGREVFADNFDVIDEPDHIKRVRVNGLNLETIEEALDLIQKVENAAGDPEAIGDKHLTNKAYGLYQIRQPYLDDVNLIAGPEKIRAKWGKDKLTIEDIKDGDKARWAARVYLKHYGARYANKKGSFPDIEVYSRIHNGGPNGWAKNSTNRYVEKIKQQM